MIERVDMVHWHTVRLINPQDIVTKQTFLLYHCSLHLREFVHMEKSKKPEFLSCADKTSIPGTDSQCALSFGST